MAIKIVVLDGSKLPSGVAFPPLEAPTYGWEQYPGLRGDAIAERCRRADIVVTLGTSIDAGLLGKMANLGLLICAGPACGMLDQAAAAEQGVEILAFPDVNLADVNEARDLCGRIAAAIHHYTTTLRPEAGA